MKQLPSACLKILEQLEAVIVALSVQDFARPSSTLGGSSIGQHVRHTLEFFTCLEKGFDCGVINYDKRAHSKAIETDKTIARVAIETIRNFVMANTGDRPLLLEISYETGGNDTFDIETSFYRELAYNIEHAVHHMAIMKIGLKEIADYITVPPEFGVAASTIRHRENPEAMASIDTTIGSMD